MFHQRVAVKMLDRGNIERKIQGKRNIKEKRRIIEVDLEVEKTDRGDQEERMSKKGEEVMKGGIREEMNERD